MAVHKRSPGIGNTHLDLLDQSINFTVKKSPGSVNIFVKRSTVKLKHFYKTQNKTNIYNNSMASGNFC